MPSLTFDHAVSQETVALLLQLAPENLPIERRERYRGDGRGITVEVLAEEDVARVRRLYEAVKRVYDLWLYLRDRPAPDLYRQALRVFAESSFIDEAQRIGEATRLQGAEAARLRRVLHDVRGGALTALIGITQVYLDELVQERTPSCVWLARDHAKMMRNALPDLDPVLRGADSGLQVHGVTDIIRKWREISYRIEREEIKVVVQAAYHGEISSRCLEASALDRILYNHLNNAARFAGEPEIRLWLLPVGELVRFVIDNRLTDEQRTWLMAQTDGDLRRLYQGGVTRGGQGIGLSTCAEFVADSFGLLTPDEAVAGGYLGAVAREGRYYAWFHWPQYVPGDEPVVADDR